MELTQDQLSQLRRILNVEGRVALASGPWALGLGWAHRAGLVRLPMVNKLYCQPVLTDKGRAAIAADTDAIVNEIANLRSRV